MNREQLAHILRAAATIVDDGDILVIGSQAILGTYDESELPEAAIASIEADLAFLDDPHNTKSDAVDGAIGELSPFHESFGIYGQGVSVSTAHLPEGWRQRVIMFDRPDALPGRARCLEAHDLVVSKLVANRPKDLSFAAALISAGLVSSDLLLARAKLLPDSGDSRLVTETLGGLAPAKASHARQGHRAPSSTPCRIDRS